MFGRCLLAPVDDRDFMLRFMLSEDDEAGYAGTYDIV
jgi:hypothetical protein